jgi:peptide/nickel transport system permease protein
MAQAAETLVHAEVAEHTGARPARWYRSRTLVAGGAIVGAFVLVALLAPLAGRYDPVHQDLQNTLAPPGGAHWLGTDQLGRDVWARLVWGTRTDLQVAFLAVLFPFCIGTILGSIAGYYGGWADSLIMRLNDIVVAFPFYVLIIALVFVLGPGVRSIYIAITIVGWVAYARIVRGEILIAKRLDYVAAARAAGLSDLRLIVRHLMPNVITQAIVFAMSDVVLDILAIVTLGYLGLGVPPPTPDWGSMIYEGQTLITSDWMLSTIPGLTVVLVGLGLSLLGDGLADVMRPE